MHKLLYVLSLYKCFQLLLSVNKSKRAWSDRYIVQLSNSLYVVFCCYSKYRYQLLSFYLLRLSLSTIYIKNMPAQMGSVKRIVATWIVGRDYDFVWFPKWFTLSVPIKVIQWPTYSLSFTFRLHNDILFKEPPLVVIDYDISAAYLNKNIAINIPPA